MNEEEDRSLSTGDGGGEILIIPIKVPGRGDPNEVVDNESTIIRSILSGENIDPNASSNSEDVESQLSKSTLSFHSVSDSYEETLTSIGISSGVSSSDEALTCAVKCGAFWKSLGCETLIYMSSYGGGLLANGLIIRFAGLDPFVSTLFFGSYCALSYNNARILFTSLVKPPKDKVPQDKQAAFDIANKYAFLPVSWLLGSAVSGVALSLLGDLTFGTQQAVSVPSALVIGPIGVALKEATRECMGGTIEVSPEGSFYRGPVEAFKTAYSPEPNPFDSDRSYRFGTLRDVFNRFIAVNLSTIAMMAYGGTMLSTFCFGDREGFLNATQSGNVTDVNQLLNEHCAGGQLAFMFRELGIALTYGLGVLLVEPPLRALMNKVYDFFYPRHPTQASDERELIIEEVSSSSDDDSDSDN